MSGASKLQHQTDTIFKKPKIFCVILHNDDYTTCDFVVDMLKNIFHKTHKEATEIMMEVHERGKGVAGVYPFDIALTKKLSAEKAAQKYGFPLKITIDEAM